MGETINPIGLASGVLLDVETEVAIDAAARAGFDSIGLWVDPETWSSARSTQIRRQLRDAGLSAIDVEVLRLQPGPPQDGHRRMIEIAAEVGAANVLVVSTCPDPAMTIDRFGALCRLGVTIGVRVAIEFMLFTEVRTIDAAAHIVAGAASPAAALLVDPLHLDRSGGTIEQVRALPPAWLPYAQFCDAPRAHIATGDLDELLREARDDRLLPGDGVLPLDALFGALPAGIPLSVELRSKALRENFPDPVERAAAVYRATAACLAARG